MKTSTTTLALFCGLVATHTDAFSAINTGVEAPPAIAAPPPELAEEPAPVEEAPPAEPASPLAMPSPVLDNQPQKRLVFARGGTMLDTRFDQIDVESAYPKESQLNPAPNSPYLGLGATGPNSRSLVPASGAKPRPLVYEGGGTMSDKRFDQIDVDSSYPRHSSSSHLFANSLLQPKPKSPFLGVGSPGGNAKTIPAGNAPQKQLVHEGGGTMLDSRFNEIDVNAAYPKQSYRRVYKNDVHRPSTAALPNGSKLARVNPSQAYSVASDQSGESERRFSAIKPESVYPAPVGSTTHGYRQQ